MRSEGVMPPTWLTITAVVALVIAFASTAYIAVDIWACGYRQKMRVMEAVWPVTALYLRPLAVWGYHRFGRPASCQWLQAHDRDHPPGTPGWAAIATGVSHCARVMSTSRS